MMVPEDQRSLTAYQTLVLQKLAYLHSDYYSDLRLSLLLVLQCFVMKIHQEHQQRRQPPFAIQLLEPDQELVAEELVS
jgi:hypothetical protein